MDSGKSNIFLGRISSFSSIKMSSPCRWACFGQRRRYHPRRIDHLTLLAVPQSQFFESEFKNSEGVGGEWKLGL